jgi:hypothetical protein
MEKCKIVKRVLSLVEIKGDARTGFERVAEWYFESLK